MRLARAHILVDGLLDVVRKDTRAPSPVVAWRTRRSTPDAPSAGARETRLVRWHLATLALGTAVVAGYHFGLRRATLTWGATDAEAASPLPGDELLDNPDGMSTRAIEIRAPASAVWPWLAQMGPAPRGGAYTYDRIEHLVGLNMHSVDTVLPEFQDPKVGDTIGLGTNRMRLELVEPQHALAWRSEDRNWVWSFVLHENGDTTRLISRNRFRLPTLAARIGMLPMEPGSLVMERKMLLGIKQRAERLACSVAEPAAQARREASSTYGPNL